VAGEKERVMTIYSRTTVLAEFPDRSVSGIGSFVFVDTDVRFIVELDLVSLDDEVDRETSKGRSFRKD
jgi:hypothetical protein